MIFLRFLLLLLKSKFQPPSEIMGEHRATFRCWPWDMDPNMHMTNSRYLGFCDIARGLAMTRSKGAWGRLRAAGLMPVVGSTSIRFRRPVLPFAKFTVVTKLATWDDRWVYFEQRFMTHEGVAAISLAKLTFVTRSGGRPPSDEVMRIMGFEGPRPPIAPQHVAKDALDRALAA